MSGNTVKTLLRFKRPRHIVFIKAFEAFTEITAYLNCVIRDQRKVVTSAATKNRQVW